MELTMEEVEVLMADRPWTSPEKVLMLAKCMPTDAAERLVGDLESKDPVRTADATAHLMSMVCPPEKPRWDGVKLYWGDRVIRYYRDEAGNQRAILAAFQEDGWPARIDDPLSPKGFYDNTPQNRLRHTVKDLNNGLAKPSPIVFETDSGGKAVVWKRAR